MSHTAAERIAAFPVTPSQRKPRREREREREREKEREEKKEARGRLNYESHPRKAEDEVRKSWDAETCAENH